MATREPYHFEFNESPFPQAVQWLLDNDMDRLQIMAQRSQELANEYAANGYMFRRFLRTYNPFDTEIISLQEKNKCPAIQIPLPTGLER